MNMVSLFSGIGGFELAMKQNGIETTLCCEIDPIANAVLTSHFTNVEHILDICSLKSLPSDSEIVCAGFPCQDLSSVGIKQGLSGSRSSLVSQVFRLLKSHKPEWIIFENVSFMLSLNKGEAIRVIIDNLEKFGYNWAYRTIDSLSFVPQHRSRVFVVASLHNDPRDVILGEDSKASIPQIDFNTNVSDLGFYWTEGRYALGLIQNALPTLKAGSTIGIPSPPAVAFSDGKVGTIDIRDAELLQGFPTDWTIAAEVAGKRSYRWRLVGNAITVNVASWIAKRILNPVHYCSDNDKAFNCATSWPKSAWGVNGIRRKSEVSQMPVFNNHPKLSTFLKYPTKPLSLKASKGFLNRLELGGLRYPQYFYETIVSHIQQMNDYE